MADLVRRQVIENWESQDPQDHLKAIRDRLLSGDERTRGRILGLFQQVAEHQDVPLEESDDQQFLRLTGVVAAQNGRLRLANPIYAAVFTPAWVAQQLAALRPTIYADALRAWEVATPEQRAAHLISGAALEEALAWASGKRLSDLDQAFLEASRSAAETARQAQEAARLAEEQARLAEERARVAELETTRAQEQAARAETDKQRAELDARNRRRAVAGLSAGLEIGRAHV